MENEISLFDLERIAKIHDIRIWLCKKNGKRWAFIKGAGEQRVLPSELVWENGDYAIFVQGENYNECELKDSLQSLLTRIA